MTYTARDQVASETRYSDLAGTHTVATSNFSYDGEGRLTNLQHLNATPANIANYTYAYDLADRLTTETLNGTTKTYSYDVTNQLTNDSAATYAYELNGNRTMTGYTTGPGNQLTSDGTWNYTYDNEGNLATKTNIATGEKWTYGYDLNNRMTSAVDATSTGTTLATGYYAYDVFGNRIEKDTWTQAAGTIVTRYAYAPGPAGGQVFATLNSSNQLQTRYLSGDAPNEIVAQIAPGATVSWYLTDRLGSVRDIVANTGVVQDHLDYDGFGNVTNETAPNFGALVKFQGMVWDSETGLYRTPNRLYDPRTGRWTSADPVGFSAGDMNLYRFVANDPTGATDPTGLGISGVGPIMVKRRGNPPPFWTPEDREIFKNRNPSDDIKRLSYKDRLAYVLSRAYEYLPEEIVAQLKELFTPTNLGIAAGMMAALAVAHGFGVGEAVDAAAIAIGVIFLGVQAEIAGEDLVRFLILTVTADSPEQLDLAARYYARAAARVNVNTAGVLVGGKLQGIANTKAAALGKAFRLRNRGRVAGKVVPPSAGSCPGGKVEVLPEPVPKPPLGEISTTGGDFDVPEAPKTGTKTVEDFLPQAQKQLKKIQASRRGMEKVTAALSKKALAQRRAFLENELLRLRRLKEGQALPMQAMSEEQIAEAIRKILSELKWISRQLKK